MSVFINGVDKQSVDVNAVQVKQSLSGANSNVNKGVYDATLLETVDGDLAVGNIKAGITIFGKDGTLAMTMTHDVQGSDVDGQGSIGSVDWYLETTGDIAAGANVTLLTTTIDCAQATVIEAAYFIESFVNNANTVKLQLYIDGVAQGETGFIVALLGYLYYDIGYGSVASGARIVYLNAHNYDVVFADKVKFAGGLFAGACKNV